MPLLGKLLMAPTDLVGLLLTLGMGRLGKVTLAVGCSFGPFSAGLGARAATSYLLMGVCWVSGMSGPGVGWCKWRTAMDGSYTLSSRSGAVLAVWSAF